VKIGIVGGVEGCEVQYRERARRAGHELRFHSGHMGGRGSAKLAALVRAVDLLLVQTDVNSHGAVQVARGVARRSRVAVTLQRRCSVARFGALLSELNSRAAS
jgi:hypothetical protein